MTRALPLSCLIIALLVTACGGREPSSPAPAPAPVAAPAPAPAPVAAPAPAGTGHAAAGVKPGSHEDWCGEHGVPESLCTRCDPSLIPAFKATNDWCAEHGLPESQCTLCHPDLVIKRPPPGS